MNIDIQYYVKICVKLKAKIEISLKAKTKTKFKRSKKKNPFSRDGITQEFHHNRIDEFLVFL